jgi:hypothetical protein
MNILNDYYLHNIIVNKKCKFDMLDFFIKILSRQGMKKEEDF